MEDDPLCAYCDMPLSNHCKGKQLHTDYREPTVCVSRHCLAPLCDCVDFVPPKPQEDKENASS